MPKITCSEEFEQLPAVLKVVGLGGAGCNAINRMKGSRLRGVELIAANTDAQTLNRNQADIRIQLGEDLTRGLGVGGDPGRGRAAAEESREQLREVLSGSDMVFITTGMGGGTGTGGAPVAARIARECHALTVGVVTRPFSFEGPVRLQQAEAGIQELRGVVDTLLVIPNDRLLETSDASITHAAAFMRADDVLLRGVQAIVEVITVKGEVNIDMNDIKAIMQNSGEALMGVGEADGPHRALDAAKAAIESPLLENVTIDGAKGLIVNIVGSEDQLKIHDVELVMEHINLAVSREAKVKVGSAYDNSLGSRLRVTVIATGFPPARAKKTRQFGRLTGAFSPPPFPAPGAFDRRSSDANEDRSKPAYMRFKGTKLRFEG